MGNDCWQLDGDTLEGRRYGHITGYAYYSGIYFDTYGGAGSSNRAA
jgi:hypothetical protein